LSSAECNHDTQQSLCRVPEVFADEIFVVHPLPSVALSKTFAEGKMAFMHFQLCYYIYNVLFLYLLISSL
jgi:hypothetical protein